MLIIEGEQNNYSDERVAEREALWIKTEAYNKSFQRVQKASGFLRIFNRLAGINAKPTRKDYVEAEKSLAASIFVDSFTRAFALDLIPAAITSLRILGDLDTYAPMINTGFLKTLPSHPPGL